jgi:hypothetical protein
VLARRTRRAAANRSLQRPSGACRGPQGTNAVLHRCTMYRLLTATSHIHSTHEAFMLHGSTAYTLLRLACMDRHSKEESLPSAICHLPSLQMSECCFKRNPAGSCEGLAWRRAFDSAARSSPTAHLSISFPPLYDL